MLFELTIFASFALYHLLIGASLFLLLMLVNKLCKFTAEMQSWLWLTVFVVSTLVPFSLFVQDEPVQTYVNVQPVSFLDENKIKQTTEQNQKAQIEPVSTPLEWNVSGEEVLQATSWIYLFLTVWIIGSFWRGYAVMRSAFQTHRFVVGATQKDKKLAFKHLSSFPIYVSEGVKTPMATGLLSPIILMPKTVADRFETKKLEPIILHELAHIQRKDLWVGLFQETLAIIFWWSPVMRVLNRKIHISRELACDMRAAKQLSSGKTYAQSLVDCAQLMLSQHSNIMAMGLFSKKSELNQRVNQVLKIKSIQLPKTVTTLLACATFAVASVSAAQTYAPKINVTSIKQEANHFTTMSDRLGDKLVQAIRKDDRQSINGMFANGLDINQPFHGEGTALIIAVKYNNRELVEQLISMGADVNQSSESDGNPLMEAVNQNDLEMVQYLYNNGADVNSKAFGDGSALIEAAKHGNIKIASFLINKGAEVDMGVDGDETPLINASQNGNLKMVKFLVENGADVNLGMMNKRRINSEFRTPLNITRNKEVAAYLISQGAINE